jgi:CDGSH-type Zn-finger protein
MPDVTIRTRPNGPYLVEGPFRLVDSEGHEFPLDSTKPAFALCRCGHSSKKPFCDGTHKTVGFVADERATPPAGG